MENQSAGPCVSYNPGYGLLSYESSRAELQIEICTCHVQLEGASRKAKIPFLCTLLFK